MKIKTRRIIFILLTFVLIVYMLIASFNGGITLFTENLLGCKRVTYDEGIR